MAALRAQHRADRRAVLCRHQLHRIGGQASGGDAFDHCRVNRAIAVHRLAATAQDDSIARTQAQGSRIGGDIGTAFVDDSQHADRHANAFHDKAIGLGMAYR